MDRNSIITLIITIFMAVFAALTYFNIGPESLLNIISSLPWYIYTIIFLICVIILIILNPNLIYRNKQTPSPILGFGIPKTKFAKYTYKSVIWDVLAPEKGWYDSHSEYLARIQDDLSVVSAPKCPKCGVELEQKKNFFPGYTWHCIGCGYTIKNKDSFITESIRATKLVKAEFGKKMEEENSNNKYK